MSKQPSWLKDGLENIWLPYTQMEDFPLPLPVIGAKNVQIKLEDGTKLVDGIASWWSACHGYQHPHITKKMQEQLQNLSHIMFAGLAHEPAYKLANRLAKFTPDSLEKVFFSDSGSTAVEVAMKMAVQFWANKGQNKRNKFLCFNNGYHGDTMGAMSLADPERGMHKVFNNFMPRQYVLDIPKDEYEFAEFEELLASGINKTTAALIIEPLVQGAGGMKFHSPDILAEIYRICKKYDILFIADEIATGFYRTGSRFACNEAGISPDIMCLGKALTAGMVGLAATITTNEIFKGFLDDELFKAFMHGPTFMANPLACSAANASLDLFEQADYAQKVEKIEQQLFTDLASCRNLENVTDVRVKGAIGVVELDNPGWQKIFKMREEFVKHGVWLRPFGNICYIMPSFTISEEELSILTNAVFEVLKKF